MTAFGDRSRIVDRGGSQLSPVVLLTAAVTPSTEIAVAQRDPVDRAKQYRTVAERWVRFVRARGWMLCVVETTGARREDLELKDDQVLFYRHSPAVNAHLRGKGALEAGAIDDAVTRLTDRFGESLLFHKVTGRLYVENADACLSDAHDIGGPRVRRTLDRSYCDTRLLSCPVSLWSAAFSGMSAEVDDTSGRYLETVMAKRLIDAEYGQGLVVERFPHRPRFSGSSGSTGSRYDRPLRRLSGRVLGGLEPVLTGRLRQKQV